MCWGLQIAIPDNGRAKGVEEAKYFNGRIATANREIPVLVGADGKREWLITTFGVGVYSNNSFKRFWNARKDALHTAHCWTPLLGQRAVIPITAYVEHSPNETWHYSEAHSQIVERAWVPALIRYNDGAGVAVITDTDQSPILTDQEHAIKWLNTTSWNVTQALDEMPRISFKEADVFMHARLKADARSRVSIRQNINLA